MASVGHYDVPAAPPGFININDLAMNASVNDYDCSVSYQMFLEDLHSRKDYNVFQEGVQGQQEGTAYHRATDNMSALVVHRSFGQK